MVIQFVVHFAYPPQARTLAAAGGDTGNDIVNRNKIAQQIKYYKPIKAMFTDNKIYHIEYFPIFKNYFYIMIIIVVIGLTGKLSLMATIWTDLFVFAGCIFYFVCYKKLSSIAFLDEESQVVFSFFQFFVKSTETIAMSKLSFVYKTEMSGRGSKSMVLNFHNDKNLLIIKLIPVASGWSDVQIMDIVDTCRCFKINELMDSI